MSSSVDIRFYCGLNETAWNGITPEPGEYTCIAPVCGRKEDATEADRRNTVFVPRTTLVIQDSGAFSDGPKNRLGYEGSLERQIAHAERYNYVDLITHRASYDLLIDERWSNGFRHKERWSEEAGQFAVKATVEAAAYLDKHRDSRYACIMSAQGVTPAQYMECAKKVMSYLRDNDIFGLGGWCILGKKPSLMSVFRQTMRQLIPFLSHQGVKRVHIWGVCYPPALGELLSLCQEYGIEVSTDSAFPCMAPAFGNWGFGSWRERDPCILATCSTWFRTHRARTTNTRLASALWDKRSKMDDTQVDTILFV